VSKKKATAATVEPQTLAELAEAVRVLADRVAELEASLESRRPPASPRRS
jgi:hypothetical protein